MQTNEGQVKMTNPPTTQTRMVKCKALTDIRLDGRKDTPNFLAGAIVELTEDEAKEFCDKEFVGYHSHSGSMPDAAATRTKVRRAVRL